MSSAEEFEEFYIETRRRILLQTYALTGDLSASRSAVRDAYVAARHHWPNVSRHDAPENWVRARAWAMAQRRHTVRPWHKLSGITEGQAGVLEALHALPDPSRKSVLLTQLAQLAPTEAGRELGLPLALLTKDLNQGMQSLSTRLNCVPAEVQTHLKTLAANTETVRMPRPSIIRRGGLRRRRNHAIVGSLLIIAATIGAGSFVASADQVKPIVRPASLVSKDMLLNVADATLLAPKQQWRHLSTTNNTQGTGINSPCQTSRFADEKGLGTWVRKFAVAPKPTRQLVQTVEISNSPGAAGDAYRTTLGWYAGCTVARLQLVRAYQVTGIGNEAQMLSLHIPGRKQRSYLIASARTGALTVSTLLTTTGGRTSSPAELVRTLATAVRDVCESKVADKCVTRPQIAPMLPPPSGETPGMLAIADLPPIANVNLPWVGTDPALARPNPAATTCDHADFVKEGAARPMTRSFLIPQAKLPNRFGLTQTIAKFAEIKTARTFMATVTLRMKACPKKELSSTVSHVWLDPKSWRGSQLASWRLDNQVSKKEAKVGFWMGVARVGPYVAQVNFTPVGQYDVDARTFQELLTRARDRLFEVANK